MKAHPTFSDVALAWRKQHCRLTAIARSMLGDADDASDAVSDVFARVLDRCPDLGRSTDLESYLERAVRNRCRDEIRNRRNRLQLQRDVASHRMTWRSRGPTPAERLSAAELAARIDAALDGLPPRPREAYLLSRHQGLSTKKGAMAMGVASKTFENHLSRALREMRVALRQYDEVS